MITLGVATLAAFKPEFEAGGLYMITFVLDLALISMIYAAISEGKKKDED